MLGDKRCERGGVSGGAVGSDYLYYILSIFPSQEYGPKINDPAANSPLRKSYDGLTGYQRRWTGQLDE